MAKECADFISVLFSAGTQTHIFHLQTKSFAKHSALGSFYDDIVDLADKYAETYQGKYGILKGYTGNKDFDEGDEDVLKYFTDLEKYVVAVAKKLPTDTDLVNIHADILGLIHSTQYKLKFLS
jgi:hypothetical protein